MLMAKTTAHTPYCSCESRGLKFQVEGHRVRLSQVCPSGLQLASNLQHRPTTRGETASNDWMNAMLQDGARRRPKRSTIAWMDRIERGAWGDLIGLCILRPVAGRTASNS